MTNQEIRNEIADILEGNIDSFVSFHHEQFVKEYPRASANVANFEVVHQTAYESIGLFIKALRNGPTAYISHRDSFASNMVDPYDAEFTQFAGMVSALLFYGRTVGPYIYQHYYMAMRRGREACDELERFIYELIEVACSRYLERISAPGIIMARWDVLAAIAGQDQPHDDSPAKRYMDSRHYNRIVRESTAVQKPEHAALTRREEDVLAALLEGKTNREISNMLGIQESTVKKHISHLFDKYNVFSRTELMAQAHMQR